MPKLVEALLQVSEKVGTQNRICILKMLQTLSNLPDYKWETCLGELQVPRAQQIGLITLRIPKTTLMLTLVMTTMMKKQMNLPTIAISNRCNHIVAPEAWVMAVTRWELEQQAVALPNPTAVDTPILNQIK